MNKTPSTYESAGVDTEKEELGMEKVKAWVHRTFSYCRQARVCLPIGYFANVLDIGGGVGIAISTDGVGTKILVAEQLRRFDTVGIDCVAMNVNDVLCVGARPIAMVDYIAVQRLSPEFLEEIGVGFQEGARLAGISIPAGEIAQVPEMISRACRPHATCLTCSSGDWRFKPSAWRDSSLLSPLKRKCSTSEPGSTVI